MIEWTTVQLLHSPKTESLLLGPVIATFDSPVKGDICAAGRTVRVHCRGIDGYVDIDIQNAVNKAVELIINERDGDPNPTE
jgi:hypothetical protein